jgi:hypothetical protein
MVDCNMSRAVWALADEKVIEHIHCLEEGDTRQGIAMLIATLKHDDQTRGFVTLWSIWHVRRKAIHENTFHSPLLVHFFVENFLTELKLVSDKKFSTTISPTQRQLEWSPPPTRLIKINVDMAVGKNTGQGSLAPVARDDVGRFMGASAIIFIGKTAVETLEALACR